MNNKWNAESIKALRNRYNLSQFLFSKILGTRQQTISEWEVGEYSPKNAYIRVLDSVEVELAELMGKARENYSTFLTLLFRKYDINLTDKQIIISKFGRARNNEIQKN